MRRKQANPRRFAGTWGYPRVSTQVMVSPLKNQRKISGHTVRKGMYPPNRGQLTDFVRYRNYKDIIDAAQYNVLVRGGLRKYEKPFYRSLIARYPKRLTRPMNPRGKQRKYQRGKFVLNPYRDFRWLWREIPVEEQEPVETGGMFL